MKRKSIKISPRVRVDFDPADSATPVMVYKTTNGKDTHGATFFCAAETGELSAFSHLNPNGDYYTTEAEQEALHKLTDEAEAYYEEARKDDPEHNRD